MNIFLSYASAQKDVASGVCFELQAAGHEVFLDKEDLPSGHSYNDRIAAAIDACDLFIFLVSPESVAKGRYALTELKIARRKWENPSGRVLPVMVESTPLENVPAYLKAVTILMPEGNIAAEIVLAVSDLAAQLALGEQRDVPRHAAAAATGELSVHYQSLQLRFRGAGERDYSLSVAESPAGTRPEAPCAIDPAALESLLWSTAERVETSVRRASPLAIAPLVSLLPSADAARLVGQRLYESLFGSPARECIEASLRTIFPQRRKGLRILINTTDAPELARLPWEFLYSPRNEDFLFSDTMKPVVRWLDVDEPPPTLTVEPPLRLLVAIASPTGRAGLSVGEELAHLDDALASLAESGVVETTRVDHTTLERLDEALLSKKPHVLHFIGHGDFDGDESVVILESDASPGAADPIAGRQLGVLLRNHLASLRLVFLNSCMGAAVGGRAPFGGVAQSLIRRGIPAVIAMQFPISDKAAVALSRHFYRYLAAGLPVDAALTSARAFLYARGYGVEWGAPALHMRTPDGRLFEMHGVAAAQPPAVAEDSSFGEEPVAAASRPSAAPSRAPASKRGSRWLVAVVVSVMVVGAIGFWLFERDEFAPLSGSEAPPKPVAQPAPPPVTTGPTSPVIVPKPPPPPPPPRPAPTSAAGVALGQLEAGNASAAAQTLHKLLEEDSKALSPERLGSLHDRLARSLVSGAEKAAAAGDHELALRLIDPLSAMEPLDPAIEARVAELLGNVLLPEVQPAAGPKDERMMYTVRPGDTLWRIAARFTGDPRNWRKIYERQNLAVALGIPSATPIVDPNRIYPGQRIAVPLSPSTGANAFDYHVSRGESLSSIAQRVYGDPQMWRQIYRDNATRIADPNLIYPDQVLILGPLPGK